MRDEKKLQENENRRRLEIVAQNADGEYWKVLKLEIEEEIARLDKKLEKLNRSRMTNKDLELRDQIIWQIEYLKKFTTINEMLVEKYKTFLERVMDYVSDVWNRNTSFVGRINLK